MAYPESYEKMRQTVEYLRRLSEEIEILGRFFREENLDSLQKLSYPELKKQKTICLDSIGRFENIFKKTDLFFRSTFYKRNTRVEELYKELCSTEKETKDEIKKIQLLNTQSRTLYSEIERIEKMNYNAKLSSRMRSKLYEMDIKIDSHREYVSLAMNRISTCLVNLQDFKMLFEMRAIISTLGFDNGCIDFGCPLFRLKIAIGFLGSDVGVLIDPYKKCINDPADESIRSLIIEYDLFAHLETVSTTIKNVLLSFTSQNPTWVAIENDYSGIPYEEYSNSMKWGINVDEYLSDEAESIKSALEILREDDHQFESLPELLLRAVLFEHTLLLRRKYLSSQEAMRRHEDDEALRYSHSSISHDEQ